MHRIEVFIRFANVYEDQTRGLWLIYDWTRRWWWWWWISRYSNHLLVLVTHSVGQHRFWESFCSRPRRRQVDGERHLRRNAWIIRRRVKKPLGAYMHRWRLSRRCEIQTFHPSRGGGAISHWVIPPGYYYLIVNNIKVRVMTGNIKLLTLLFLLSSSNNTACVSLFYWFYS